MEALKTALGGQKKKRELTEGRSSYRVAANLPATIVMPNASATVGTVVNFSGRGLKVMVPASVPRNSTVVVTVRGRQPLGARGAAPVLTVKARVIWCKRGHAGSAWKGSDFEAGLEFQGFQDMRLGDVVEFFRRQLRLDLMDTAQKRRMVRIRRRLLLTVQVADGEPKPGFTRDLTLHGVRFAARDRLAEGTPVHLEIDLQDKLPPLTIDGVVGRCDKVPKEDWFDLAVPFKLQAAEQSRLERLMTVSLE